MSQQTLGSHDHQRLAPGADGLAPQALEMLSGSRRINDLHIVFGAEMQKSFKTSAGVLGSLSFEAVGQKQNNPAESFPLVLPAGYELINNRLGGIPEIAELSLPENEPIGIIEAEAIFETQDSGLGQWAIENLNRSRIRVQMSQRHVSMAVLIIVKD